MRVHPIDAQSYDLTLGKFGNFGFEVEPTIALRLLPQHKGIYRIETIPSTPKAQDLREHYDVDFQASMHLIPMQESGDEPNPNGQVARRFNGILIYPFGFVCQKSSPCFRTILSSPAETICSSRSCDRSRDG